MIRLSGYRIVGLSSYFTWPLFVLFLLGIVSGLPLALVGATLTARLHDAHVDIGAIGLFAAVGTPYTLKFLWSPFMDSLRLPLLTDMLGLRRGWIFATQLALALALLLLGAAEPGVNPWMTAGAALLVAFLAASQDIVIDAYRVELLSAELQGQGAAMAQLGYRMGMLLSGAGGLSLAQHWGWQSMYSFMALGIGVGMLVTLAASRPPVSHRDLLAHRGFARWLREFVIDPFLDFTTRESWWLILVFIVVYKLADAFIGGMSNPFFLDLGFSKDQIAGIVKIYGTLATIAGTMLGGLLTTRYGALRIMFVAGFLHGLTNLLYVLQAHVGADAHVLALSITVENFTSGISAAAFVGYLSGLCNLHYTATQFALLSSLSALGRTWLATPAGFAAKYMGWSGFFAFSALLAAPGLITLWMLSRKINRVNAPR